MLCCRRISAIGTPASPCFRMSTIWLSVKRDFRMSLSLAPESLPSNCLRGGEAYEATEGARGGERQTQTDVRRSRARERGDQGRLEPKAVTPSAKREVLAVLVHEHQLPVRRACQAVRLSRAAYYRPPQSRLAQDTDVVAALNDVVARHARWGFWKCFYRLRRASVESQAGASRVLRAAAESPAAHEAPGPDAAAPAARGTRAAERDVGAGLHGGRAL